MQSLKDQVDLLKAAEMKTVLPQDRDLKGAANALDRLLRFYRLSLPELTAGKIYGIHSSVRK